MKVEKQADGSEVHVFERRPWREEMPQKPCYECRKMIYRDGDYWEIKCCTRLGRLLCRIAQWVEHVRLGREERKQNKICSNCSEYAEWDDKMAEWNENREYWASRAGMAAATRTLVASARNIMHAELAEQMKRNEQALEKLKRRIEDDKGSERKINGEADEERDKEADAED